jgi:hypothetical protein
MARTRSTFDDEPATKKNANQISTGGRSLFEGLAPHLFFTVQVLRLSAEVEGTPKIRWTEAMHAV